MYLLDVNRRETPPATSLKLPVKATLLKRFCPLRKTNPLSFVRWSERAPPRGWSRAADRCLKLRPARRSYYLFTRPRPLSIVPTYWSAQTTYQKSLNPGRAASGRETGPFPTTAASNRQRTCDAKPVVGVLELRRNARARRVSTHLDVMPPGTSPRSLSRAIDWSLRISIGRVTVIVRVVPIGTPFVHVVSHVRESVCAGGKETDRLRPTFPAVCIIGERVGR